MADDPLYEPRFVAALFDEMSASYGITNYVSSFGFCERWRRQTVEGVALRPGMLVVDLMSGMGECWRFLQRGMNGSGRVIAVDLSAEMCRRAQRNRARYSGLHIELVRGDALNLSLPDALADALIACFGLKTFSRTQIARLAHEVFRLLKPGGVFSFVEIAVPRASLLRLLYLFYLRYLIPVIGRLFLGNPDNYRLLAVYTQRFASGHEVAQSLLEQGFVVTIEELFFGCARRITGRKP